MQEKNSTEPVENNSELSQKQTDAFAPKKRHVELIIDGGGADTVYDKIIDAGGPGTVHRKGIDGGCA